jgi:hypothetical protein
MCSKSDKRHTSQREEWQNSTLARLAPDLSLPEETASRPSRRHLCRHERTVVRITHGDRSTQQAELLRANLPGTVAASSTAYVEKLRKTGVSIRGSATISSEAMPSVEGTSAEVVLEHPQMGCLLANRVAQQLTAQPDALMCRTHIQAGELECGRVRHLRHAPAHDTGNTPVVLGESHDSRPGQDAIAPASFALYDPYPIEVPLRHQSWVRRTPAQGLKLSDDTRVLDQCAPHRKPRGAF